MGVDPGGGGGWGHISPQYFMWGRWPVLSSPQYFTQGQIQDLKKGGHNTLFFLDGGARAGCAPPPKSATDFTVECRIIPTKYLRYQQTNERNSRF